ncbi:MAG: YeeE/YedE family protein [Alphaproteobacteria bacterium]|nr:YeeE/YedE family protein [Alphaproteobacteria bacterium]
MVAGGPVVLEDMSINTQVAILAFVLGGLFGITAQRTNFCTMGALSDVVFIGDWNRFRAWMLAIAVAMLTSQGLELFGVVDLSGSIYRSVNLGWLGAIIGGLMFGFGMTLAGGCANKTLVRLGGGNLKSIVVVLVLGMFAYMTLRGLIGLARVQLQAFSMTDVSGWGAGNQGMPELLAALGAPVIPARIALAVIIAGGLAIFCFKDAGFRRSPRDIGAGLVVGLLVAAAWVVTGVVGADEFDPVPLTSMTFVAPIGESLQYLMTFTGASINFGIAAVGGIVVGAFLSAVARREFHIESFTDADDMLRHLVGAALMGTGGVLALGCTIGQGITGMSTLSLGSLIAIAAIIVGGLLGLKYQEEGSLGGAIAALVGRS